MYPFVDEYIAIICYPVFYLVNNLYFYNPIKKES